MKSVNVARLLWVDSEVFENRFNRIEAILVAVVRVLESRRPLDGKESIFIQQYAEFTGFSQSAKQNVLRDPAFSYWIRVAYELLRAKLQNTPLPRLSADHISGQGGAVDIALVDHLAHFGIFCIGAALLDGARFKLAAPISVSLPLSIPGSEWNLTGSGTTKIADIDSAGVTVNADCTPMILPFSEAENFDSASITLARASEVKTADCQIYLKPSLFNLSGLDFRALVLEPDSDYQEAHQHLLESAINVLARYQKDIFAQFRSFIRVIAMKPSVSGTYRDNLSHSDLPGAMVLKPAEEPHYLAHVLVHEFHHNRLFCIEDGHPILEVDTDDVEESGRCYSPWRVGPRPYHGILHGLYVTIPVIRYWLSIYLATDMQDGIRALAHDQIIRGLLHCRIAQRQLIIHANFTEFGNDVMAQFDIDIDSLEIQCGKLAIDFDPPSVSANFDSVFEVSRTCRGETDPSVKDDILDHIDSNASEREASDLRMVIHNRF